MTTTEPSSPGRVLGGRYRLVRPVARGGMGEVWLAEDALLDRRVALKSLLLGAFPDAPELRRRAFREAKALARVAHPGIVGIYDVLVDGDDPWIVMELVRGVSLADVLAERATLPERDAARTALALLDALDAAHRSGVVHRDVKPANIMVEDDGRVRLIDFGIAYVGGASKLTRTGLIVGTADYLAPERIKGADAGPPADLWSLGVVLFEALEGRSPFRRGEGADAPSATLWAVMNEPPPRPVASGRLAGPVLRLLEKDPAARLTSDALRRALRRVLAPPAPARGPVVVDRPIGCGGVVDREPPDEPPTRADAGPRRAAGPRPPGRAGDPGERVAGRVPPGVRADELARMLAGTDADGAAAMLRDVPPETVRDALSRVGARLAGPVLRRLPRQRAAQVLAAGSARTAGALLAAVLAERGTGGRVDGRAAAHAAAVLQMLGSAPAAGAVAGLDTRAAVAVLSAMPPDEAARILARAEPRAAAEILGALPPAAASRVIGAMPVRPLCAALGYVPPAVVADLLRAAGGSRTETILRNLDRPVREKVRRRL
ncbi:protein kinase domain-containing protein [Actinomadura algeriensis]|uniref:non-specific serine/threonine protein kinase n=1 Tax=Actinomadura algeriensis TaxID=1679523 RepID=A0ABR9JJI0_9ACTN|nr:protein kinase [Actinomadura algeriensis]MBE1530705.1 flagellar motility protein MotE (MotC chaperone) [Actinomadura algeriensis]